MFNLFGRRKNKFSITDQVWLSKEAKAAGILKLLREQPGTTVLCWFRETLQELETYCSPHLTLRGDSLLLTRDYHTTGSSSPVVFAEHYPLYEKEEAFYTDKGLRTLTVYSSLDEVFFTRFGGENIAGLMRKLGLSETESIEHTLISRSIRNAQDKIAQKISFEQTADSPSEWFRKNGADAAQ